MCALDSSGSCADREMGFGNTIKKLHLLQPGNKSSDISERHRWVRVLVINK
jgi:hypothetical protein